MYSLSLVVLAVATQVGVGLATPVDDVTKDTELLLAFMIHRHGDRTPKDETTTFLFSSNVSALIAASEPYGFGQLTLQGKQRAYRMGQYIRRRYDSLISAQYNSSKIYIHSTDVTRSKMSVLIAMAAVFPLTPGNAWSDSINWDPVPYTTTPVESDPNMASDNCIPFTTNLLGTLLGPLPTLAAYDDILTQTTSILNLPFDLKTIPGLVYSVNDLLQSQINIGVPLSKDLEKIYPQIEEAAGEALRFAFSDLENSALMSGNGKYVFKITLGVLLNDFFESAHSVINNIDTPKLRVYSSHDTNTFAFESILQLTPKQGVPHYSAVLSLELRRDSSGKVFVLPVYLPTPGKPEIYLHVEGCDGLLCSFEQFTDITSKYAIDVETWKTKCWSANKSDVTTDTNENSTPAGLLKSILQQTT